MRLFRGIILGGLLLFPVGPGATANAPCGTKADMEYRLLHTYSEKKVFEGVSPMDQRVISLWVHPETRDWTLLLVWPNGEACFVAAGEYGEFPGELAGEPL